MTDITAGIPRAKLKELVERHGESLLRDPDRCEGLLKDYCGAYRREISALMGAMEERIPLELKSSWQTAMTPEAMRARLVQRLEENRGLAPEVAGWAVDAWSYALGVGLARRSDRVQEAATESSAGIAAGALPAGNSSPGIAGRVPSDGAGSATTRTSDETAKVLSIAQMSTPKKAGVGAAAALIFGMAAFAVMKHHPATPPLAPAPNPTPAPIANAAPKPEINQDASGDSKKIEGADNVAGKDTAVQSPRFLPVGTVVSVHLDAAVNSDHLNVGDFLDATVNSPVTVDGNLVVSSGAEARLKVTGLERTAKDGEAEHLQLALVELGTEQGQVQVTTRARQIDGPTMHVEQAKRGIGSAAGAVGGFVKGKLFHHGGAGAAPPKGQPVMVAAETPIHFRLSAGVKPPVEALANK
jgi:hypothetical protein